MLKIQDVVAVLDVVSKQKVTATRLFPHQLELTAPQMCFEVPVAAPTKHRYDIEQHHAGRW